METKKRNAMKDISKKISEIIEIAQKNPEIDFDLMREQSLSLSFPAGKSAYFKQKIYELKQKISNKSMIGRDWVANGCSYNLLDTDWMQRHTAIALKYMVETEVWNQIQLFVNQYLKLLKYKDIITNESEHEITKSFPEYLIPDNRYELAERLKNEFKGKKGKNIAIMILALKQTKNICYSTRTELYKSIDLYFNCKLNESGINKYMDDLGTAYKLLLESGKIEQIIDKLKLKSSQ